MSNFSDFIKNSNNTNSKTTTNHTYTNEQLESMIDNYSKLSNDKLMSEFIKLTIEKKKRGELKDSELESLKSTILPMLNDSQKVVLNNLLEMVKNVK